MVRRLADSLMIAVFLASLAPPGAAGQEAPPAAKPAHPARTADGQPDIQGYWSKRGNGDWYSLQDVDASAHAKIFGQKVKGSAIVDPPDKKIPYQPWAAEKAKFLFDQHLDPSGPEYLDPVARGFAPGTPRANMFNAFRILQPPGDVVIVYEFGHFYRVIPLDGRPRLSENVKLWMGDSRGRWEGNTLVVETTNHNAHTFLDAVGSFHSDALRVVERWSWLNPDRIDYEVTLEDPKVYTRAWKMVWQYGRNKPQEMWEFNIYENNRIDSLIFDKK